MSLLKTIAAASATIAALSGGPADAEDVYKIGVSAGLTGYAAAVDRSWRDGLEVAAEHVNASGGIMGRKVQVIVEDNKSEPQEAVTVYRKMISSDRVSIFLSGCVSAGNFAAAQFVVRARIPMVLCSILPPQPDQVKWAYSLLPPPRFEVEKRYEYLKSSTAIRKAGVLHDPSPYGNLQKDIAVKDAPDYGIEIPVVEQYKQDDADFSPQISKMNAAGAKALIKIGIGGSTLTVAKNIKQLGLDMLFLGSVDDLAVFKPAAEVLGGQFLFVAAPSQVYDALPEGALKREIGRFLPLWRAKQGERDPGWAGKGWDALMLTAAAIEKAKSFDGPKVRDALETLSGFQGTGGVYNFSPGMHQGITQNPFLLASIADGAVRVRQ
ncbi:MAG TPA: ABC transporter substrate-binding protein [Xanthobacteraceae bacterium]|jgi:branched-chain amino acid transport system substrate-binding protein